jgi:hypothetical protein
MGNGTTTPRRNLTQSRDAAVTSRVRSIILIPGFVPLANAHDESPSRLKNPALPRSGSATVTSNFPSAQSTRCVCVGSLGELPA